MKWGFIANWILKEEGSCFLTDEIWGYISYIQLGIWKEGFGSPVFDIPEYFSSYPKQHCSCPKHFSGKNFSKKIILKYNVILYLLRDDRLTN